MFAQARRGPPVRAGRPKAEARKLSQIFLPTIADRVAKRISGARPPAWPGHGLTKRKHPFELSGKKNVAATRQPSIGISITISRLGS